MLVLLDRPHHPGVVDGLVGDRDPDEAAARPSNRRSSRGRGRRCPRVRRTASSSSSQIGKNTASLRTIVSAARRLRGPSRSPGACADSGAGLEMVASRWPTSLARLGHAGAAGSGSIGLASVLSLRRRSPWQVRWLKWQHRSTRCGTARRASERVLAAPARARLLPGAQVDPRILRAGELRRDRRPQGHLAPAGRPRHALHRRRPAAEHRAGERPPRRDGSTS